MIAWIFEVVFHTGCGWLGHHLLRVVSFGRIAPGWGSGSESVLAESVGLLAVLGTVSAAWILLA